MTFQIPAPAPKMTTATPTKTRPPPAIHHSAKQTKQLDATNSTALYVNNVSIRFPAGINDANLRNKAATFFATMQRVDPSLALLPLKKEESDLPVILSGSSFPTEFRLSQNYFTIPAFTSKLAKIHCYLQTTKRFRVVKFNNFVHSHLWKYGIWIDSHNIESFDIIQVGWFEDKHMEHYPCHYLLNEAKKILPEELHEHIQINIRTVQYYK